MRRLAPRVPAASHPRSATLAGAEALGFASELGSIEPGKRAQLLAVRLPADVADVEEYLVGGIEPERRPLARRTVSWNRKPEAVS